MVLIFCMYVSIYQKLLNFVGDPDVAMLRDHSQKENFSAFGKPVLGWFVTSEKSTRARRAIGVYGTPGVTPTMSVQGTPTLIPSASVDVKTSIVMSVAPSTTLPPIIKTSAMPTDITPTPPTTPETKTTEETTTKKKPTASTPPTDTAPPVINLEFTFNRNRIVVVENSPKVQEVPSGLFSDSGKLTVKLLYKRKHYDYDTPSWITYRDVDSDGKPERKLYIFPSADEAHKQHDFALEAKDPVGLSTRYFFRVEVRYDRVSSKEYKFKFNATIDVNYDEYVNDVRKKLKLIQRLTSALYKDDSSNAQLRDVSFTRGSVVVAWSDSQFKNISCNSPNLIAYKRSLENNHFRDAMSPEYPIKSTGVIAPADCMLLLEEPIPEEEDDSLWERILIPVIVIVVILLIIILILCCVYRRKRSYETATDETYLNHKKPVIFLEEFQEKPGFVSLEPLILPNEKPPATDQAYAPRGGSPDGPESSTSASSENDESTPLAPNSPKETRAGFNAPPPYSAR